jgi:hypothetical protein
MVFNREWTRIHANEIPAHQTTKNPPLFSSESPVLGLILFSRPLASIRG